MKKSLLFTAIAATLIAVTLLAFLPGEQKYYVACSMDITYQDGTQELKTFYKNVSEKDAAQFWLENSCIRYSDINHEGQKEDVACGVKTYQVVLKQYQERP